jgi:hypothetical protein
MSKWAIQACEYDHHHGSHAPVMVMWLILSKKKRKVRDQTQHPPLVPRALHWSGGVWRTLQGTIDIQEKTAQFKSRLYQKLEIKIRLYFSRQNLTRISTQKNALIQNL